MRSESPGRRFAQCYPGADIGAGLVSAPIILGFLGSGPAIGWDVQIGLPVGPAGEGRGSPTHNGREVYTKSEGEIRRRLDRGACNCTACRPHAVAGRSRHPLLSFRLS